MVDGPVPPNVTRALLRPARRRRRVLHAQIRRVQVEEVDVSYQPLQSTAALLHKAALNYGSTLCELQRHTVAKPLLRHTIPVAQRVFGDTRDFTLMMRWIYAMALYKGDGATLDELREAVETLVDIERTARRVLGGAHPKTEGIEVNLRAARAALRARETGTA